MQISEETEYKICFLQWISKDMRGEKEYVFLLVPAIKVSELRIQVKSMQAYNPSDYGIIVESGIGQPTKAVMNRIKKEFSFEPRN